MATRNHHLSGQALPGEDLSHPTRASKTPEEVAKIPGLYRGVVLNTPRSDLSGYGANGASHPASVGVAQSGGNRGTGLADFDTTVDDPVKAALATGGMNDRSGQMAKPTMDLERKIAPTNVGDAKGMASARSRQSGGVEALKDKGLPIALGNNQSEPVRKAGR